MRVLLIDGQDGKMGKQLAESTGARCPDIEITAASLGGSKLLRKQSSAEAIFCGSNLLRKQTYAEANFTVAGFISVFCRSIVDYNYM